MLDIATERPSDAAEVEALFDVSFAPGREALSSYRLRDGVPPEAPLCLVARDEYGALAGAIRFWRVAVSGPEGAPAAPALLLGPIAVHPIRQGEGVGARLMADGLSRAREAGWTRVALVGDAPYYGRFGFAPAADFLAFPPGTNPKRILAKALAPGGWDGVRGVVARWREGG